MQRPPQRFVRQTWRFAQAGGDVEPLSASPSLGRRLDLPGLAWVTAVLLTFAGIAAWMWTSARRPLRLAPVPVPLVQRCGDWTITMMTYAGETPEVTTDSLCQDLLRAAERSGRGQAGSDPENRQVRDLISRLELAMLGQRTTAALLNGTWELAWASDDVTRSSPFFWAFRQAFPDTADQIFGITDSVPNQLKGLGPATQTISANEGPEEGALISRVQIKAFPDLPVPLSSTMITTAAIIGRTPTKLSLRVQDTRVREATLPLWDQTLPFPSGQALELVKKGSSEVIMTTIYLDDRVRISRNDADGSTFVWKRV